MCLESVNPNSHASLATIVTTLCYKQIFLVRKPLSLRHTHVMMKGTSQALPKMQRSPSASSQEHQRNLTQSLANDGIKWSFIPPHLPHWGGKWESSVRSIKLHLGRLVGKTVPTFEHMQTLIAQISAVESSRTLCYTDLTYLSAAHFLIGRPFTTVPEGDLTHLPINRLDY